MMRAAQAVLLRVGLASLAWMFAAALLLGGCATPLRGPPEAHTAAAVIPGLPRIRYYLNEDLDALVQEVETAKRRELQELARSGHRGPLPPLSYLALSGGGDNGAFGVGLLLGWTATGDRPQFRVATGISTGALIAPFAFLGSDHDHIAKEIYTNVGPSDSFERRGMLAALFDDALADSRPLAGLIERYVTPELMARIAEEHEEGRWLLVATTNLDARRPVIWNLGAIAASGDPDALVLIHKILLGSASIPGVFPPVMIDVEVDGRRHQELHVDGGAVAQVFLFPSALSYRLRERTAETERDRQAYIVRNARLDPDWASTDRRTLKIMGRSVSSLIESQGTGDLYQIYLVTQQHDMRFNLAFIRPEFRAQRRELFDTEYMRELFAYGYERARNGYPWVKSPLELYVDD